MRGWSWLRAEAWALAATCLTDLPAAAHSGAVAVAVPVSGITVDGELSDWPEGTPRYPLAQVGQSPGARTALEAWFRAGHDAARGVLYLAVETRDQSAMVDTTGARSGYGDQCRVAVDLRHEAGPNGSLTWFGVWATGGSAVSGFPV